MSPGERSSPPLPDRVLPGEPTAHCLDMNTPVAAQAPAPAVTDRPLADTLFGASPTVASELEGCDRCGSAAAKVKARYIAGPVYLCGHHARLSWDELERTALSIRADLPTRSFHLPMAPRDTSPLDKVP